MSEVEKVMKFYRSNVSRFKVNPPPPIVVGFNKKCQ